MYSDLFDALGGNAAAAAAMGGGAGARQEPEPLIAFKAGKMEMTLQENGRYWCVPDTRRAKVQLRYNDENALLWEWYDRREKSVSDTIRITSPVALKKVDVPSLTDPPTDDDDDDDNPCREVYYWKLDNEWKMLWLQDKEIEEGLVGKVNEILKHPTKPENPAPAPAASNSGSAAARNSSGPANSSSNNNSPSAAGAEPSPENASSTSSASTTTRQVDALSNILGNLGMPQGEGSNTASTAASNTPAPSAPTGTGGTLTLADLQGAMAGMQQQQPQRPVGLQDVVTQQAITDLLDNEAVRQRLIEQLPEGQRTAEHLEENLRSPQVQATLRSLTAALMPDDNGSIDGYHSVLANFQLDANAGQGTLMETNNPIEAFLAAVLASVNREAEEEAKEEAKEESKEESKDEEMKD